MNESVPLRDLAWVLSCAALVMLMQAGFCCLESGLARAKNRVNVAIKNLFDFCIASVVFWLLGFGLMFGASWRGVIGTNEFMPGGEASPWLLSFFLFQMVFCGTSTTIISGAVAERIRFVGYLAISVLVSALFYPVFGHWAWGGLGTATPTGWLAKLGFIDFAGSTVVHSTGGWLSLAAVLVVGPRLGRFDSDKPMHSSDLPLATLGVFLLWFGWFGFNGGSTLAVTDRIPLILVNTNLAAAAGGVAALVASWTVLRRSDVGMVMNGVLGGLVGGTAGCNNIAPSAAILTGLVAGALATAGTLLIVRWKIDDVVGAVPVHAFCGVWGTLAVALLGDEAMFLHGSRSYQFFVQLLGAAVCFTWAFGGGYVIFRVLDFFLPLRASAESERMGLNLAEHDAGAELVDLLGEMESQRAVADFSRHVTVEPHTEVGQIATAYNRVLDKVQQEMTSREQVVEALRQAEEKYRSIFENAVEGIFQTTLEGQYLNANPALARIYGYESVEALRVGIRDIGSQLYVDPGRRNEFRRLMDEQGAVRAFESQVVQRDGSRIWISENVRLVRDAEGRPQYYEGTVEDITERRESEALRTAKDAAEAACEAKSSFLAHMSHEIRTPLNGVIGMLDLLAGTELNDRQKRYAQVAKNSADSLLSVINQILDFSKIEAGKVELEALDFDPRSLVEDTLEIFVKQAHEKGLELACHTSAEVPVTVRGDQDRLRQVIVNLINNALKFTERGEIVIRTTCEAESDCEARLRFSVQDTGMGIPPERREQLFQSFSQLDASTTRRFGGTGLGLCISKGLVELMGGRIGVDSHPGEGSTFWCSIPFGKHGGRRKMQFVPEDLRQLHVLAVDDNVTNLEVLYEQFQSWGLSLTTASDGRTALHMVERAAEIGHPFDLAILDVQMPVMDGLELARLIKCNPSTSNTTLIVLTSMGRDLSYEDMQRHGLAGYMHKPVRQSRLWDAIVDATSRQSVEQVAGPGVSAEGTPRSPLRGRVLVAEDNDVNQIVVTEILTLAGFDCDVVASGRAAVQRALSGSYDLVLMDCQMPEMDGFAAAQHIRKTEAERAADAESPWRVPIVALTANAIKGDRERCLNSGMDAYLSKPVDSVALLEIIEKLITQYDEVGSSCESLPTDAAAIAFDELLDRCVNNHLVAARVLEKFSVSAPRQLERMHLAVRESAAEELARVAHLLRGMAANVSAKYAAELAGRVESAAMAGDCRPTALAELSEAIDAAVGAANRWIAEFHQDQSQISDCR